ncbi:MAG: hypothetical protein ABI051_03945 [Vicinamibacterales bacterium]
MNHRAPWRVLVVNTTLAGRTGTETATRDIALGLLAAGQRPMVYSPRLGGLADDIHAAGIPVVSHLGELPHTPDIVHGHHHVETVSALFHFPEAAGLFVCHDRTAANSAPPLLARIRQYVAVDLNCRERLTGDYRIADARTTVIPNAVDLQRFHPRLPLPARPARAAIFSNYAEPGADLDVVRAVCERRGLTLDAIGAGMQNLSTMPARVLGDYDVVFAKGRCALEAMAVGCAVILQDRDRLGPMVTAADVEHLRRWNFGRRTVQAALQADALDRELARYDPSDAAGVSTFIRVHSSLDSAIQQYVDVYRAITATPVTSVPVSDELVEYCGGLTARIGELESAVEIYRLPYRMEMLDDEACAGIQLRIVDCPTAVACGGTLHVSVGLANGSAAALGTYPPYPVDLGFRWIDAVSGDTIVREGPRTSLRAVPPGGEAICTMRIPAPSAAGRYRLHVALVQEGLRWLDQIARPLAADVVVTVGAAAIPVKPA